MARNTQKTAKDLKAISFKLVPSDSLTLGNETEKAFIFEFEQLKKDGTPYNRKLVIPKSICTVNAESEEIIVPLWKLLRYDLEGEQNSKK